MVSNRLWLAMMKPYRAKKPFFRRLDLTKQRSYNDTEGMQQVSDPAFRTLETNAFTGEAARGYFDTYPIQCGFIIIANTAAGVNDIIVQPPLGETWLYDKGALAHDDVAARICDIYFIDDVNALVCALHTEGHVDIPNGGDDTPIFPSFHEEAGNTHYHLALGYPLQLDHLHYLRIRGVGFAANHAFWHQFIYRRVR